MTRSQKKRIKNLKIAEAKGLDRQAKRIKVIALVWTNKLTKQVNPEKHLFGRLLPMPHLPISLLSML